MSLTTGALAGIPVICTTLPDATEELLTRARLGTEPTAYRLVNSYTFALAEKLRPYHHLLRDYGVNLPDGRPLVHSLNLLVLGAGEFEQVRGPSLFMTCLDRGRRDDVRHFFLGGTQQLLDALVAEAELIYPGITICGTSSPPFRDLTLAELDEQDEAIRAAGPDIIWVGLGTPKQDFEAQRLCDELKITTVGVGAAFDFLAGSKREAPLWLRKLSMEWSFRLLTEPRRLWRRYLFGNTRFIWLVVQAKAWPGRQRRISAR